MHDASLSRHVVDLLLNKNAHVNFEAAVRGLPQELRGVRPDGQPHTVWRLVEHLRIAQHDILEFSRGAEHVSPPWPEGYWPPDEAPTSAAAWDESLASFGRDLEAMCALVNEPSQDLHAAFPWGDGQTLLREALLVADHNAYHVGQIVTLRQLLGAWP